MVDLLEKIGYKGQIGEKNKFAYMITGIGLVQIVLFFMVYAWIGVPKLLILQTLLVFVIYGSALIFLKIGRYGLAKNIIILTMVIQVFLLTYVWFPRTTYLMMYYFIVPPIAFIVFDLDEVGEQKSLIGVNLITSLLIMITGLTKPHELIVMTQDAILLFRVLIIVSTFFVEILVFYFYAFRLNKIHKELSLMANTDVLTNIANRRVLFEKGPQIFEVCHKYQQSFTLMILDIDHFKVINDQYGHPVGDDVLVELTDLISRNIRKEDLLCRYGGEEFAVLFRNVQSDQVEIIRNLKRVISSHVFQANDHPLHVSFSAGVVISQQGFEDFETMVVKADELLYKAKMTGRNRVVFQEGHVIL